MPRVETPPIFLSTCLALGPDAAAMLPGDGIPDTDIVLYVTANDVSGVCSNNAALAYADSCQRDQNDRPTAGFINFCQEQLDSDGEEASNDDVLLAIHEMFAPSPPPPPLSHRTSSSLAFLAPRFLFLFLSSASDAPVDAACTCLEWPPPPILSTATPTAIRALRAAPRCTPSHPTRIRAPHAYPDTPRVSEHHAYPSTR